MYLRVILTPGTRKECVTIGKQDELLISVREPAKQNHANKRMCELVALHYHKTPAEVRILNGHRSPTKMLSIKD